MIGDLFTPRRWPGARLVWVSETPEPVRTPYVVDDRPTVVCRCGYERYVGDFCGEPCV